MVDPQQCVPLAGFSHGPQLIKTANSMVPGQRVGRCTQKGVGDCAQGGIKWTVGWTGCPHHRRFQRLFISKCTGGGRGGGLSRGLGGHHNCATMTA